MHWASCSAWRKSHLLEFHTSAKRWSGHGKNWRHHCKSASIWARAQSEYWENLSIQTSTWCTFWACFVPFLLCCGHRKCTIGDMTMIPWNQQSNAIEALGFTNFMNCIFEELPNRVSWRGLRLGSEILSKLGTLSFSKEALAWWRFFKKFWKAS